MDPLDPLQCLGGKHALNTCIANGCKDVAILCGDRQCQCHNPHTSCIIVMSLANILETMTHRGELYFPVLRDVVEWYKSMIKVFETQIHEIARFFDQSELTLGENGRKLYELLKSGETEKIKTPIVISVLTSLAVKEDPYFVARVEKVKQEIGKSTNNINRMCAEMRQNWNRFQGKAKYNMPMSFSLELRSKNIRHDGPHRVCVNVNPGSPSYSIFEQNLTSTDIVLMNPCLEIGGSHLQRIQFKAKGNVGFGVCYQKTVAKNGFVFTGKQGGGVYSVTSDNRVYSNHKQPNVLNGDFNYTAGGIVEVMCNLASKKVEFTNKENGSKTELEIVLEQGNQLHFCVVLGTQGQAHFIREV